MIKQKIQEKIQEALKKLNIKQTEIVIEEPANSSFGDYATNLPLRLTKELKKNPLEIAKEIAKEIQTDDIIEKVDVAPPGFINFWVAKEFLLNNFKEIIDKKNEFGTTNTLHGKRITVEFTDPNPFKEFHIGHLYSNIVGESLSRLLEAIGGNVRRVCYQGDVGMHVAKSIWGLQEKMKLENETLESLGLKPIEERVEYLGKAYALGATKFEEDEKVKQEIVVLNKKIYQRDPSIEKIYNEGRQWSLDYFEEIYRKLGTEFKGYYFERDVGEIGFKIVKEYLIKGVFEESQGAIIFPGKKYGLHDRVFINSQGLPTYEAKELGLAPTKNKDWPYDQSIIVTANEINEYFKVLIMALKRIYPELGEKTKHIGHGVVRLPDGKMSSRTGKIVTGEELIQKASEQSSDIIKKTDSKLTNLSETSEIIGIGAIKYALLKNSIGKDVVFNFKESVSFDGNSGPYLQYAYVRCQSILNKSSKHEGFETPNDLQSEELILLRSFAKFPFVVEFAGLNYAPNVIANYLYNLAKDFSSFYEKVKILNTKEESFRTSLIEATSIILKNGLNLLGIRTIDSM